MMNNAAYIRAIRGPVLLMTLGFLMLLDHLTSMSFWRLWPALLIVMGILFLAERATGATPVPISPGMPQPPQSPYGGPFTPPGAPRSGDDSSTTLGGGAQ